jgi:glycosyltransferase involved in cell wall biosynthesis
LYLEQAISSASNQTWPPHEIIVFNDCSTDNTKELLDKLERTIPCLRVFHQPVNVGISKNVDGCLRMVSTEYAIRLDSDDQLLPRYAELALKQFVLHSNIGYVHSAVQEIDLFGRELKKRMLGRAAGVQSDFDALKSAVKGFKVSANILMFKVTALRTVNYVKTTVNFAEDYYMVSAISAAGYGNVYIPEILANYRVWNDEHGLRRKRKLDEIRGIRMVIEEVLEPAFKLRNWSLSSIEKMKVKYAKRDTDCLGWGIYSVTEKQEIRHEILLLSSSASVRLYAWLYQNNGGFLILFILKLEGYAKSFLKSFLFRIHQSNTVL